MPSDVSGEVGQAHFSNRFVILASKMQESMSRPRPECALLWRACLLGHLPNIRLALLVGQYAERCYLSLGISATLRDITKQFEEVKALRKVRRVQKFQE